MHAQYVYINYFLYILDAVASVVILYYCIALIIVAKLFCKNFLLKMDNHDYFSFDCRLSI